MGNYSKAVGGHIRQPQLRLLEVMAKHPQTWFYRRELSEAANVDYALLNSYCGSEQQPKIGSLYECALILHRMEGNMHQHRIIAMGEQFLADQEVQARVNRELEARSWRPGEGGDESTISD